MPNGCSTSSRPQSPTWSSATSGRGRSVCGTRRTTSAEPCAGRSITARPSSASGSAAPCWRFWFHWAELREGITWLETLLALPGSDAAGEPRARALSSLAALWFWQGRGPESLEAYLEVVSILRSLGIEGERLGDALDDAAWGAAE